MERLARALGPRLHGKGEGMRCTGKSRSAITRTPASVPGSVVWVGRKLTHAGPLGLAHGTPDVIVGTSFSRRPPCSP